ncbi:MAG: hypothetical protein JWM87_3782 [Candidatus Eremiobacteraeota bacterium]|nr:hypothetical protein [Candidatus Eremiobacteraeota bacterium]
MDKLVFSPWYINTRRLSDVTRTALSPAAQVSVAHNNLERVAAMSEARFIAQRFVDSGKVPNLADLIVKEKFPGRVVAGVWSNAIFRGSSAAAKASHDGKRFSKPTFSLRVLIGDDECILTGTLEIEHYYSSSAVTYMSRRTQAYFVGQYELAEGARLGTLVPWLIGDLLEPVDVLPMSWGRAADVYVGLIDAFVKMRKVRPPAEREVVRIMRRISEAQIKQAFSQLIGEPFVPKDWGGERSDLYTSRLSVDGKPTTAAFLLKGPSVPGPMHVADTGKRGDQIPRLFEEPADLMILQHCNKVETSVVKTMRVFAVDPARPRSYCIIDGVDTYCILKAYGYLDKSDAFKPRRDPKARRRKH